MKLQKFSWQASDLAEGLIKWTAEQGIFAVPLYLLTGTVAGAIGVAGGPVWATLGVGALLADIGYTIYQVFQKTDQSLDDLLKRIDALDYKGTVAEPFVAQWIVSINQIKKQMQSAPAINGDQSKDLPELAKQIQTLKNGLAILKRIQAQWPKLVKPHLKDWFGWTGPNQFDEGLKEVIQSYTQVLQTLNEESKQIAEKVRQQRAKGTTNITGLMINIKSLTQQITKMWAAPKFSPEEQKAIAIGNKAFNAITLSSEIMQQINAVKPTLLSIQQQLQEYYNQIMARKKKKSAFKPAMSKRAVEVAGLRPEQAAQNQAKRPGQTRKMPVVQDLQRNINTISQAAQIPNSTWIDEDGVYGPKTVAALKLLIDHWPQLGKYFAQKGVWVEKISDPQFATTKGLRYLNIVDSVLKQLATPDQSSGGQGSQEGEPTQTEQQKQLGCVDRINPSTQDIMNCLHSRSIYINDNPMRLYDYLMSMGLDDNAMLRLITDLYGGRSPETWNPAGIVSAVGNRYGG